MSKLQTGRRALWALAAILSVTPIRTALAKRQGPQRSSGSAAGASSLIWARNEKEFRQALTEGAAEGFLPMFDPRTDIELSSTIVLEQRKNEGMTWGANGNHAKIRWVGSAGQDMVVIQGVKGVPNRGFYFEKFNLYGGGYNRAPCGACLKLRGPFGDTGALYKFTLRDIFTSYGTYGIVLEGAVFEGMCENVHGENHARDGMYMENTNVGSSSPGIVSNIQLIHPNMSRNLGAGVRSVYSCNAAFGSFVLNAEGGIVAPAGLRVGFANNGENTGEALYVVPNNGYGSYVLYSEASTDGRTVARRFDGARNDWVSVGKPTLYVLAGAPGVTQTGNHIATYGDSLKAGSYRVVK
jgi:hypothetical protein